MLFSISLSCTQKHILRIWFISRGWRFNEIETWNCGTAFFWTDKVSSDRKSTKLRHPRPFAIAFYITKYKFHLLWGLVEKFRNYNLTENSLQFSNISWYDADSIICYTKFISVWHNHDRVKINFHFQAHLKTILSSWIGKAMCGVRSPFNFLLT